MKKRIFILAVSLIAIGRVLGQTCNSGLAGCTTCAMGDAFDCTACRKGFILVTTGGGKGQCTRCFDGTGSLGGTATLCAVTCDVGCETCTDVSSQCLLCRAGYLWKAGQTCQRCPDGTGKSGDANEILSEATAGSCSITCPRPCNNCDGATPTKCVNCVAGFFWAGKAAGTCNICTGRTGKAIDSVDKTTQVAADTCAITCTGGCEACDQTQTKCLNCRGGYFWTGTACMLCSVGKGKAADTADKTGLGAETCGVVCTAGCEACSDTTNYCLNCKAGYRWISATTKCDLCTGRKGKDADTSDLRDVTPNVDGVCGTTCTETSGCNDCEGNGTSCLNCREGYYWNGTPAKTCTMCPNGSGIALDAATDQTGQPATTCGVMCTTGCNVCGGNAAHCLNCVAGHKWAATTPPSCTLCTGATGKNSDDRTEKTFVTAAETCPANCDTGTNTKGCEACDGSDTFCLTCKAGHKWLGSATKKCQLCADNTGKAADTTDQSAVAAAGTCGVAPCTGGCNVCGAAGGTCVNCKGGYAWAASMNQCNLCTGSTGKAIDTVDKTVVTVAETCATPCTGGCDACLVDGTTCLNCKAGFRWNGSGTCTICGDTTGKGKDTIDRTGTAAEAANTCTTACSKGCNVCQDTNEKCVNCKAGYFWGGGAAAGTTCSLCVGQLGKPKDTTDKTIVQAADICTVPCVGGCEACTDVPATCLTCKAGYRWKGTPDTLCVICNASKGKAPDTIEKTGAAADTCGVDCIAGCDACDGLGTTCFNCKAGFYWTGATKTCQICMGGSGKIADTDVDKTLPTVAPAESCNVGCLGGCNVCAETGLKCVNCKAGYKWKGNNDECLLCDDGKGKLADEVDKTVVTLRTIADTCGLTCTEGCNVCGKTTNTCVNCKSGYRWNGSGCQLCEKGFRKPKDTLDKTGANPDTCISGCTEPCNVCGATTTECVNCMAAYRWSGTSCVLCAGGTGKAADTTDKRPLTAGDTCDLTCAPNSGCESCSDVTTKCRNCKAGYFWKSETQSCPSCDNQKGKGADSEDKILLARATETCTVNCTSPCNLCGTAGNLCVNCVKGYKSNGFAVPTIDTKACSVECTVENCITCGPELANAGKCSKCADNYRLKSETECEKIITAVNGRIFSPTESSDFKLDIVDNQVIFNLGPNDSKTVSKVYAIDLLTGTNYTCAQINCKTTVLENTVTVSFDPQENIIHGRLVVERSPTSRLLGDGEAGKRRILADASPLVVENFVMFKSDAGFRYFAISLKVFVLILRLPFSLLVFWRYPYIAFLMDLMVTNLRVYKLIGQPYMAYVEYVFQIVGDSKILPFGFSNPFFTWNSETIGCMAPNGLKSKGEYCSFFDNYGENVIGLIVVIAILAAMAITGRLLANKEDLTDFQKSVLSSFRTDYGAKFFLALLDANSLEIICYILIAYTTAEGSSKTILGIFVSTVGFLGFVWMVWKLTIIGWKASKHTGYLAGTRNTTTGQQTQETAPTGETQEVQLLSESVLLDSLLIFAFKNCLVPKNKLMAFFHVIRYSRSLLLGLFVMGAITSPVAQTVPILVIESLYFCSILVLNYQAYKFEFYYQVVTQVMILLHLVLRAISTSSQLTLSTIHTKLSMAIALIIVFYILLHIVLAILVIISLWIPKVLCIPTIRRSNKRLSRLTIVSELEAPPKDNGLTSPNNLHPASWASPVVSEYGRNPSPDHDDRSGSVTPGQFENPNTARSAPDGNNHRNHQSYDAHAPGWQSFHNPAPAHESLRGTSQYEIPRESFSRPQPISNRMEVQTGNPWANSGI